MTSHSHRPQKARRRGAALVEMALVLPIFLAVVLGIIEFGRAMMVGQLVTNASREGARLAILDGTTNADVETAVREFLQSSLNVQAGDVSVDITVSSGTTLAEAKPRDLVTVRVAVPYNRVNYIPTKWLKDAQLTGQTSMRHE